MRLTLLLDWNITVGVFRHVPIAFRMTQAESGSVCRHKKGGGHWPPPSTKPIRSEPQTRRVSTKFWPAELVQFSWLVDTIRQLKLTAVWRISDVPLICTDVAPVIV